MNEHWIDVASAEACAEAVAIEVIVQDQVIAVFRQQGELFALDGMCAHQGGPIASGKVHDGCVTCPWHGWQYELASGIQTINRKPLQKVYRVRELNGRIEVCVSEPTASPN